METSPSEPVPPEVIAIAVALAVTMSEPGADEALAPAGGHSAWRWDGWD